MSATIDINELKKTMPWTEHTYANGLVQIINAQGQEVPLFVMTGFLQFVTSHMAKEINQPQPQPQTA